MNAIHARSQLRYWPTLVEKILIVPDRLSKTAFESLGDRSRGLRLA